MIASKLASLLKELGPVKLLAVTKQQSIEKIVEAVSAGVVRCGENYLQEAISKIESLKKDNIEWHFIGRIQSNKTKEIAQYFDWVHSIDRKKIATRLNDYRPPALLPLNVIIEINESGDPKKAGVSLNELEGLILTIQSLPHLKWRGLMTMLSEDYEKTAKAFYDLQKQGYDIDTLSMGMSQDYPEAIRLGSTMVRIGTHIFGERKL